MYLVNDFVLFQSQYSPSYLACPETYSWIPIEKCIPKLDAKKYSRLDDTNKGDFNIRKTSGCANHRPRNATRDI